MASFKEFETINMADMKDLGLLKNHVIYSDEFKDLPEDQQRMIYAYCKCHATYPACLKNLAQIRYAVTKIYFGY